MNYHDSIELRLLPVVYVPTQARWPFSKHCTRAEMSCDKPICVSDRVEY